MNKYRIIITGIVQGVGFRPFIYNLSTKLGLKGWVGNEDSNVIIEIEANKDKLVDFLNQIRKSAPTLSKIESIDYKELPFEGFKDFTIKESQTSLKGNIFISPDVATCNDCLKEIKDRGDRRYLYPFINCTNCGPRFTIIKDIPYDRDKTTMDSFYMCDSCRKEYTDPADRRYHAQPIACHRCGPSLEIVLGNSNSQFRMKTEHFKFSEHQNASNLYNCTLNEFEKESMPAQSDQLQMPLLNNIRYSDKCDLHAYLHEEYSSLEAFSNSKKCIEHIAEVIKTGQIAAIKGIGGYHLSCDALNDSAIERLRNRKHRDKKPFAIMMKNLDVINKYCKMNDKEIELLKSPASPIVLLEKKEGIKLPELIAPLNKYLGVMLPYTPIHHILFKQDGFPELIVMTSGNLSSEPIFYKDDDAINELSEIADVFLTHNREIYIRTDDSVTRVFEGREYIIRRSRGYVPKPIILDIRKLFNIPECFEIPSILACGGELKNVFCMNKDNLFYLSHHIGDLENESTNNAFISGVEHFKKLFDISYDYIAYDLHPNYFSSQYALKHIEKEKIGIQHHKAHIAACMAENQLDGEVIGVSFDGTGYGDDGNIWGGEFFKGGYYGLERVGHLDYVMMPGSDSAVKHPWRMAVSYLYSANKTYLLQHSNERGNCETSEDKLGDEDKGNAQSHNSNDILCANEADYKHKNVNILDNISQKDIEFTIKMLEKKINCPKTSSMGRFFDAVSALLGINTDISYEGQAAIELEYYAIDANAKPYILNFCNQKQNEKSCDINLSSHEDYSISENNSAVSGEIECVDSLDNIGGFVVQTNCIIEQIIQDMQAGNSKEYIASRFHSTIAEIVLQGCILIRKNSNLNAVVLSGGVFQNITLLKMCVERLRKHNFNVFTHSEYPANDGGIALGQAVLALGKIIGRNG
ncbi:carbamoyltransferase HypF [Ruminiclostridium herbifermentans]|uniref:carbamoyltransferase HypF n=1 Tax=Ruminiclostridium herbifermentans TaxID=2488810 RepID=UPI001FD5D071|nr:carbamoyltransferase HypF [Ruminiclostridium herbifermentans]